MTLIPIHIIAGVIAIAAGFVALWTVKGMKRHRKSGTIFVYSMLVLAGTGATIATIRNQPANVMGGLISIYLVTTGVLTLRRRDGVFRWIDTASMAAAIALAFLSTRLAMQVAQSPTGKINGVPPAPLFAFGAVAILGAAGDLRMMLARGLQGTHRIARHLWRMCFAMFIASGSFFLGQAKVLPQPIRIMPLLAIPAFLPLVFLVFWLVRVLFTKWYLRAEVRWKPAV
jgi:uncharacterized membrane protein